MSKKFSTNQFHDNPTSDNRTVWYGQKGRSWQQLFSILKTGLKYLINIPDRTYVKPLSNTAWFKKMKSHCKSSWLEQQTAPQHTPDSWLRYSKFSARSTGWLGWATLKTLFSSSHVLLWYTWSAVASAFAQTAYLLKLVIPTTNALPCWRLNVETKTKRTLYSSRRLSFNELTNAKSLV